MPGCAGIILAGGRATRMEGRDKALLPLAGRPLGEWCIARLAPQAHPLAISSNAGDPLVAGFGLPVIADDGGRRAGPLSGVLAGMRWAAALPQPPDAIVTVAVDTPFFPTDLVERLAAAREREGISMAASGGHAHPTFAIWPLRLAPALERFIAARETLKVTAFAKAHDHVLVDFPFVAGADPFFNVNAPADLAEAASLALRLA